MRLGFLPRGSSVVGAPPGVGARRGDDDVQGDRELAGRKLHPTARANMASFNLHTFQELAGPGMI